MGLVALDMIARLHPGHQLLEEEVLVIVTGHIEIAVPRVVGVRTAGIRHNNDHRTYLACSQQFISHLAELSIVVPGAVIVAQTMKQIEHGIGGETAIVKGVGSIDIILHPLVHDSAVEAVGPDHSLTVQAP